MQKLIEIEVNPNILVSSNVLNFDKPEKIYIPIKENANILIHNNERVSIGTSIIEYPNDIVNSTISGKVSSIKKVNTIDGIYDAIEIINDYKEKTIVEASTKRSLNKIKKETFDSILLSNFKLDFKDKKNLVLNCIDDEPYVLSESFYLFLYYEGFLELLDKISKVYKLDKIIIAVKTINSENINKLMSNLGMYPNITIEVEPNLYLIGKEQFLLRHLNLEENETIIIKASKFYNIYNLIKRNRLVTNKLITITGDGIINPSVIKVKIGTEANEVISNLIETKDEVIYIANGLMQGNNININNFVITEDINSILIMKNREIQKEYKCINCGACSSICPVNINPLLLNKKNYKKKIIDKCLKCGLCSYICPANINFNKYLKGDSNE
ncbi:MAG: 4Fe-4S dicluster domain-containing protein [Firmicutes bacterium]|nr:4Fe-4S dicluster domain-containing protein [Bacillota bacterium]